MEDEVRYEKYWEDKYREYEDQCARCGSCCGAGEDDPCAYLRLSEGGGYRCAEYDQRTGLKKTVSGKEFLCVPIRRILFKYWIGASRCAYKRGLKA
jgi:hypothetical protein